MEIIAAEDLKAGMEIVFTTGRAYVVEEVMPHPEYEEKVLFRLKGGVDSFVVSKEAPVKVVSL